MAQEAGKFVKDTKIKDSLVISVFYQTVGHEHPMND